MKQILLEIALLSLLITMYDSEYVYAEHVFKDVQAYAQYLDISQLESEKVTFTFDGKSYDVYYGYHGSLDAMGSDDVFPTLSSMNVNEERKSIEILVGDVPEKTDFWIRIPENVLYAEGEKFVVLVDHVDTRYDLMKFPNDYVLGFIIDEKTKSIEIIGTKVIPEFGMFAILLLSVSMIGLIFFTRKLSFVNNWNRF